MKAENIIENVSGYEKLADELRSTLNLHLKNLFESFADNADNALFELANEAGNNDEQKQFFELLQEIRANKKIVVRGLYAEISNNLKSRVLKEKDFEIEITHESNSGELSLISQDSMEEMILINTIDRNTSEKFKEEFGELGLRLDYLADKNTTIFHKSGLSARCFCKALRETVALLNLTMSDKLILYKLYDNEVTSKLNTIYDILNNILIEAEILPNVKLYDSAMKHESSEEAIATEPESESHTGPENSGSASQNSVAKKQAHVKAGPRYENNVGINSETGTQSFSEAKYFSTEGNPVSTAEGAHRSSAGRNQYSPVEHDSSSQDLAETGKVIGGYPVKRASEIIGKFIGSSDISSNNVEGSAQFYGHNDVISALSKLQAETHSQIQVDSLSVERIDANVIKHSLLTEIANEQGGSITKQIGGVLEKTIDFIKLIFDAIIDDKNISDTIKALLLTLQIPVIKASMLDSDFFIDDNHPARQLLDRIADIGVGVTSHTDTLYKEIYEVVQILLDEYKSEKDAFVKALQSIEDIRKSIQESSDDKERAAQRGVQKDHARKVVLWELRKATYGKKLTENVHMLILKLWPTMMFNHYIKHGKENDEWLTQVSILTELISSIQLPSSTIEYDSLKNNYRNLVTRVKNQLCKYKDVNNHIENTIDSLQETIESVIASFNPDIEKKSSKNIKDDVIKTVAEENIKTNEPESKREKLKLLPSAVRPGVWMQLTMENNRSRRLKLSIILVEEALLIFVDHNGNRVAEREAEELADELEKGKAVLIVYHSVFDSALTTVFETIQ